MGEAVWVLEPFAVPMVVKRRPMFDTHISDTYYVRVLKTGRTFPF